MLAVASLAVVASLFAVSFDAIRERIALETFWQATTTPDSPAREEAVRQLVRARGWSGEGTRAGTR